MTVRRQGEHAQPQADGTWQTLQVSSSMGKKKEIEEKNKNSVTAQEPSHQHWVLRSEKNQGQALWTCVFGPVAFQFHPYRT